MPATAPPPHATAAMTPAETAIVREVNRVRRAHGLRLVRLSARLARVARSHSRAMLAHDVLTHDSFDGTSFSARLRRAGRHRRYGETLAWAPDGAQRSAKAIVSLWMGSAPHRAVLLDGGLHRIGVGRVHGAMGRQRGLVLTADFSS